MKHVKSFALFENENWDLFDIQRMLDAGLMTPTEAAPAMRTIIRRLLAEAGTSEIWSEAGIEALREIPAVAAVGEPEAQPLWDAGFKPVSSIIQLAQGTLDWERIAEPADRDMTRRSIERLVFYEKTGYVRQMIGQALHVLIRSNPGGGLSFFKDKMRELNDRFAVERQFVPSRKTLAAKQKRDAAETAIESQLNELFGETASDLFIQKYLEVLASGFTIAELNTLPQKIQKSWPLLPIRFIDRYSEDSWRILFDYLPSANKFYLVSSPILHNNFTWQTLWFRLWQAAIEAGKVEVSMSKPVRFA
jgi:hypothetical protein